jgi:Flp pilus assembly protein TadG
MEKPLSRRWVRQRDSLRRSGNSHSTAGSAAIEFALVFLFLWGLGTGVFRIGYSIYLYQSLSSAVAGAARYAAHVDFDSPAHTFVARVRNVGAYGSPTGGSAPLAPSLVPANFQVTWATDSKGVPLTMTLSLVNYSANGVFQNFSMNGKPSITVRFAGRYKT